MSLSLHRKKKRKGNLEKTDERPSPNTFVKKRSFLVACALLLLAACTEIPPQINPIFSQGECLLADAALVADQKRNVLIEEFSGVRCANCPAGSAAIGELGKQYGEQLVAVSIHTGFFARPYSDNLYDFRTPVGDALLDFLKAPIGFPSAVINRKLYDGETDLQLGLASWAGYIAGEVLQAPAVKLYVNPIYDDKNRELSVEVSVFPQQSFTGEDVRLSLMITENNVADVQLTPSGKETQFNHLHVLRDMLTNFEGNPLSDEWKAGRAICQFFQTTLSPEWLPENSRIVAFVHRGGDSKEVLQALEVKFVP